MALACISPAQAATFTYDLTYDAANRVTQVTADGTNQVDYTWQDNGQLLSRTLNGDTPVVPFTITVTEPVNGSITAPAANIDCGSTCQGSADQDTTIELTATGASGYAILAWGDDCASATGNTCTLTMDADKTVSATFETDTDNDGIGDSRDNCVNMANPAQENTDGDTMADICDPDDDNDGIYDGSDNCSLVANTDQLNTDGDNLGDVCDPDDDNDGIDDAADNCPLLTNADQLDTDGDNLGNACDPDDDNDGIDDTADNCPLSFNPDQRDKDNDGRGDLCEFPWTLFLPAILGM